jgi:hypothetical protein
MMADGLLGEMRGSQTIRTDGATVVIATTGLTRATVNGSVSDPTSIGKIAVAE